MSADVQGTKWYRNIAKNFNRRSKAHKRFRQTTNRQTGDDIGAYSERERSLKILIHCFRILTI